MIKKGIFFCFSLIASANCFAAISLSFMVPLHGSGTYSDTAFIICGILALLFVLSPMWIIDYLYKRKRKNIKRNHSQTEIKKYRRDLNTVTPDKIKKKNKSAKKRGDHKKALEKLKEQPNENPPH